MQSWKDMTALGVYLGIVGEESLERHALCHPAGCGALKSMHSVSGIFLEKLQPGEVKMLLAVLAETDLARLAKQDGDRIEQLSTDTYLRYTARSPDGLSPDSFRIYLREYLRRFEVTLRGALCLLDIKKEAICLDSPVARKCIEELRRLPCRKFGESNFSTGEDRQFAVYLSDYARSLLKLHVQDLKAHEPEKIADMFDRLAAHPDYFKLMDSQRKAEAAGHLLSAIADLRANTGSAGEKSDLIAALGILLFNVLPDESLIKYLMAYRPGTGNRHLLYGYNAMLSLNLMRMGKTNLASRFCQKAYDAAPGPGFKAYARVLQGCIALEKHSYPEAIRCLENGLEAAGSRKMRSLIVFYLGIVRFEAGEIGHALNCFREARLGAEEDADVMAAGNNIGICNMLLGDPGRALKAFQEVEARGRYSGRGPARMLRSIAAGSAGIVYASMLEHDLALDCFRRALRSSREAGNTRGIGDYLLNIGLIHKHKGDYNAAIDHFVSALSYAYTIGYLEGVVYAHRQIRETLALHGRHGEEYALEHQVIRRHPGIARILGYGVPGRKQ